MLMHIPYRPVEICKFPIFILFSSIPLPLIACVNSTAVTTTTISNTINSISTADKTPYCSITVVLSAIAAAAAVIISTTVSIVPLEWEKPRMTVDSCSPRVVQKS